MKTNMHVTRVNTFFGHSLVQRFEILVFLLKHSCKNEIHINVSTNYLVTLIGTCHVQKQNEYRFPNGIYGTQSIFICFMSKTFLDSESLCTETSPILLEGGNGDTTCSINKRTLAKMFLTMTI